jgi:uncharacterized membrane protein
MRTTFAPILAMLASLAVALALDLLTKDLLQLGYGTQMLYGVLGVQVLFAATFLLLAQFALRSDERRAIVSAVFIATGIIILVMASPAFTITLANAPPDSPLSAIFHAPPLFPLLATQRFVEAAAFVLVIGLMRLISPRPRR